MEGKFTRADVLKSLVVLPALAAAFMDSAAIADAKSPKTQFKYQNHPKGTQKCSGCSLFIPGKNKTAMGGCKVVAGSISPNGWCTAYSAKK
ncbi:MAG: high-potential iron-sulfur protein [Candidatus Eremiobacteraeota bacterium]|nr:high-potential iron-sulfur protein [Candidatus Eremiobacteraeota bacterium]